MKEILKCSQGHYTMKKECPVCGKKCEVARPVKYSVHDKYAIYRRKVKEEGLKKEGLL